MHDDTDKLPRFSIPTLVLDLPAALIALPADARVYVTEAVAGRKTECITIAGDLADLLREKASRQSAGWLEIEEAAQLLHDAKRGDVKTWLTKLSAAAQAGALPMHEPGSLGRVVYASAVPRAVRGFYEWAHVDDLNRWLEQHEPRLPFRFSNAVQSPPTAVQAAPHVPRMVANVERVRQALISAGFDPNGLPPLRRGCKCPAKQAAIAGANLSRDAFDHAWKELPKKRCTH